MKALITGGAGFVGSNLVQKLQKQGWGLVNIEANAMGTSVVSYNSVGLIDSVSNNDSSLIVKNNSLQELAIAIDKLLANKKIYEKLCISLIKWNNKFLWKKARKLSLSLLESIRKNVY